MRRQLVLLGVFCLLLGLQSVFGAEGRIPISESPYEIWDPGSYIVTNDLYNATGYAIQIRTDNVSIDLDGHIVRSGNNWAIWGDDNKSNLRIKNGILMGDQGGVSLYTGAGGVYELENLNVVVTGGSSTSSIGIQVAGSGTGVSAAVHNNLVTKVGTTLYHGYGIDLQGVSGHIEYNKITLFQYGIYGHNAADLLLERNIMWQNTGGVVLSTVLRSAVRNNLVSKNTGIGIYLMGASYYNTIADNSCNDNTTWGIFVAGSSWENSLDRNVITCNTSTGGQGMRLEGCRNIYSMNKIPGPCTMNTDGVSCGTGNENIDGLCGNTP
jgi:parallel beta-helix repeat protein